MNNLLFVGNSSLKPLHHHRNLSEKSFSTAVTQKKAPPKLTINHNATTVLNFDPTLQATKFLTSPRSIEALNRLCINEDELLMKKAEDFMHDELPAEFQNDRSFYIELKLENYEKRRQEKVKMCIEEREKYIEELTRSHMTHSSSMMNLNRSSMGNSLGHSPDRSSFLEMEAKKTEKQRKIFKTELERVISSEMKQRQFQERYEQKLKRLKEMEETRTRELRKKLWAHEKEKEIRSALKMERERQFNMISNSRLRMQELEARRQRENQERLWHERQMALKEREQQKKMKAEMLNKKLRELEQKKKEEAERRKKALEEKNEKSRLYMMATFEKKQKEGQKQRSLLELKITNARKSVEKSTQELRNKVDEKFEEIRKKRERLESERKREIELKKQRNAQKDLEMKRIIEEKQKQEERRRLIYAARLESIEKNRAKVESALERRLRQKAAEALEKENRIKEQLRIRDHMEASLRQEKEEQIFENIRRAEEQKQHTLQETKKKFLMEIIRLQDAAENVARLEKVKARKQQMWAEKMNLERSRAEQIQQDREFQSQHRKRLQQILNYEKHTITTEFDRRKRKLFLGTFDDRDMRSILASPTQNRSPPPQVRPTNSSAELALLRFRKTNNITIPALNTSPQNITPKKNFFFMNRPSVDLSSKKKKDFLSMNFTPQKPATPKPTPQKPIIQKPTPKPLPKKPDLKAIPHTLEELINKQYEMIMREAQTRNFTEIARILNDEISRKPDIMKSSQDELFTSAQHLLKDLRVHEEEYDNIRVKEDGYFLFKNYSLGAIKKEDQV